MPAGLQIFQNGKTVLDITSRVGVFIGRLHTNGQMSGSISNSRFSGKRLFAYCITTGAADLYGGPLVTLSGNNLNWSYPMSRDGVNEPGENSRQHWIYYGVY